MENKCKKCLKHLKEFPKTKGIWIDDDIKTKHLCKVCTKTNLKLSVCKHFSKDSRKVDGLYSRSKIAQTEYVLGKYHENKEEE